MKAFFESVQLTRDILRGVNQKLWGGKEGVEKVATMVKTGISGTDTFLGINFAIEDYQC